MTNSCKIYSLWYGFYGDDYPGTQTGKCSITHAV
jgi:hypothetical protein